MGAFLVKDIKLLLRDRSELLILLAMPFLLIAILGFSLRGIFSGDLEALEMDIALVAEEDEAQAVASIQNEIGQMGLPPGQVQALKQAAQSASPQKMLISLLEDENLSELITVERMARAQAQESLDEETVDAVITLPEGFTEDSLRNMLFGSSGGGKLELLVADLSSPQTDVLHSILQEFVRTVNFEASISRLSGREAAAEVSGGIETITARQPITSFQYYTVGMAVMFVLFVGSTIAGQANLEQKQMVFDRIRLSDRPPLLYLTGKAIAAAAIVTVQLALLFGLSALLFQTFAADSWAFWSGIAIISITLALSVGCLAALMVAITLRLESDAVPAIFSGGVISLMAFVGGSFMPLDGMPEMLRAIGNWTPNGAALSAYFSWLLEPDFGQLWEPLMRIAIVAAVFLSLALALFPRKGGTA
ncbi:ABC transporter permease [Planococcus plakortidis]